MTSTSPFAIKFLFIHGCLSFVHKRVFLSGYLIKEMNL